MAAGPSNELSITRRLARGAGDFGTGTARPLRRVRGRRRYRTTITRARASFARAASAAWAARARRPLWDRREALVEGRSPETNQPVSITARRSVARRRDRISPR